MGNSSPEFPCRWWINKRFKAKANKIMTNCNGEPTQLSSIFQNRDLLVYVDIIQSLIQFSGLCSTKIVLNYVSTHNTFLKTLNVYLFTLFIFLIRPQTLNNI